MAGMTYFCTDSHGNLYTRYSARHVRPEYTFASIYRREGTTTRVDKHAINYSRRRDTAEAIANRYVGMTVRRSWDPVSCGYVDDAHRLTAEVVAVRAYEGRHKVEPTIPEREGDTAEHLSFMEWWDRFNQELSLRGLEHVGFSEARGFYAEGETADWASDAADRLASQEGR